MGQYPLHLFLSDHALGEPIAVSQRSFLGNFCQSTYETAQLSNATVGILAARSLSQ